MITSSPASLISALLADMPPKRLRSPALISEPSLSVRINSIPRISALVTLLPSFPDNPLNRTVRPSSNVNSTSPESAMKDTFDTPTPLSGTITPKFSGSAPVSVTINSPLALIRISSIPTPSAPFNSPSDNTCSK